MSEKSETNNLTEEELQREIEKLEEKFYGSSIGSTEKSEEVDEKFEEYVVNVKSMLKNMGYSPRLEGIELSPNDFAEMLLEAKLLKEEDLDEFLATHNRIMKELGLDGKEDHVRNSKNTQQ